MSGSDPVRLPSGLRWTCGSCAACCRGGFELGPVEPEVVAGLRDADIGALWAPAGERDFVEERQGPDGPALFLAKVEGACVFLRDDGLCAVHALLGPDAKPGFCREFPYHLVRDPDGLVAVVRPDCGGFHHAFRDAPPVRADDAAAVESLPRVVPRRTFAPETVRFLPGLAVDLSTWMALETHVLAELEAHPERGPGASVAAARSRLYALARREPPPRREDGFHEALSALIDGLAAVLAQVEEVPDAPPVRRAFAREARELLERAAARLADARLGEGRDVLPPPSEPLRDYLHLLLRSHVLAKQWEAWGGVDAGLGHFLLGQAVARLAAGSGDLEAFDRAYRPWLLLTANPLVGHVLRRGQRALVDLFLHA